MATAAIINGLWDLWARLEGKPVWKLVTDMTPEVGFDKVSHSTSILSGSGVEVTCEA